MELEKNTLLHGGTYRIEKALGQGSFGITYLATHTALNRKVAIKEFFMKELNTRGEDGSISGMTDGSLSYNYGQKFKKEAMNLSQLDHPNIVRVTDSFEENGTYYYVMDYIEGENLNDYLKHNAVSQQEAVSIITDVAKALQYMHDTKHMLHLDLKPGNIMRRASDGHIFLIDFGLSKHYSNSGQPETSTTIGLGTPGYAPIEQSNQAKNGEFRPTIDVYALGATLYKLLTRETPPAASDIVSDDELIEDKLRTNGITSNIINVVVNAMLPNVKKRTQTVKDFIEALNSNNAFSNTAIKQDDNNNSTDEETQFIGYQNTAIEKASNAQEPFFMEFAYEINPSLIDNVRDTECKALYGNTEAMFGLAMMYLRGDGKKQSLDEAYRWFTKCKDNGDGRAVALLNNWDFLKKKYKKSETHAKAEIKFKEHEEAERKKKEEEKKARKASQKSGLNSTWLWTILGVILIAGIIIGVNTNGDSSANGNSVQSTDANQSGNNASYSNGVLNVDGVTYDMINVQAGTFTMGATSEMKDPYDEEKQTHQVTTLTNDYYIGKTEVTQALWKAVMGNNPSNFKGDNLPVECVSWNDCKKFISKLNSMSGKNFRLPTEAEWEFAARGGNNSNHYQYSGSNKLGDVAWYDGNSGSKTHAVATKQPNELGIYDMSGNVWEWCSDWCGNYSSSSQTNPTGPNSGSSRVIRGGCWFNIELGCRSGNRWGYAPDFSYDHIGFRLALSE